MTGSLAAARGEVESALSSGDAASALARARSLLRLYPRDHACNLLAARAELMLGDTSPAAARLGEAVLVDPRDPAIRLLLAACGSDLDGRIA